MTLPLALLPLAHAATLDVGPGQPFATVADAVAAAVAGDTVKVHAATLAEEVVVGTDLTLVGVGRPRWAVNAPGRVATAITVTGGDVTVRGFVFDGPLDDGVLVRGGTAHVELSVFVGQDTALTVDAGVTGAAAATVTDSVFRDHDGTGGMVAVVDGGDLTVERARFVDNASLLGGALAVDDLSVAVIRDTTFARSTSAGLSGGALECRGACEVDGGRFVENDAAEGSAILSTGALTVRRSLFCGNTGGLGTVSVLEGEADLENVAFLDGAEDPGGGALFVVAPTRVWHGTFAGNGVQGGPVFHVFGDLSVSDTVITGTVGASPALHVEPGGTYGGAWNAWFGNDGGDADVPLEPGDPVVLADPRLAPGARCAWGRAIPAPASPLRDAANPQLPDADGTPADIGALGGPEAPF